MRGIGEIGRAPEPIVVLEIPLSKAEEVRDAIADLTCWMRGFVAARPDDHGILVDSLDRVSRFNADLKDEIAKESA